MTSNTCDLRGQRVDDALTQVDRFLSQLLERRQRVGFVLHGHGTGALKQAVRRALPDHPQVRRWRPAHPDEGGDAYTLVEI
jgi:DNA mismatch repair protein MutS2